MADSLTRPPSFFFFFVFNVFLLFRNRGLTYSTVSIDLKGTAVWILWMSTLTQPSMNREGEHLSSPSTLIVPSTHSYPNNTDMSITLLTKDYFCPFTASCKQNHCYNSVVSISCQRSLWIEAVFPASLLCTIPPGEFSAICMLYS